MISRTNLDWLRSQIITAWRSQGGDNLRAAHATGVVAGKMPARSWAGGSRKYTKPSGSLSFRKQAEALPGLTLPPSSGPLPKASHIILHLWCMHRNGHFSMTSASSILFPTVHYPQSDFFPVPMFPPRATRSCCFLCCIRLSPCWHS